MCIRDRFDTINEELKTCSIRAIFFSSITNPSTRFVNGLVYSGVGIFGAVLAMQGVITVGQLSCFLTYANQYTKPFNEISSVLTEIQNAFACAKRVFDFIDEEVETQDKEGALILQPVSYTHLDVYKRQAVDYGEWFGGKEYSTFIRVNLATKWENIEMAADQLIKALIKDEK